ncbi:MAG: hypothetical protein B7Y12_06200 [Rhizobiales bacterium 24-66-13]|jgi:hypothetical protein|nr:MAG: hypothetical protein B7Y61_03690 [Rhizobiales bacterium 35-66-30]OYZ81763.1 MAG: hypothetical protein B7Y12_06200 [Rhizobiales bacterium 24-66-13]OZB10072.1 MAG: hypothetical protein B7X67_06385 [Rhizobiales bacterium 39-66-18]HQS47234.1 hypothetical protein [Xanthobacteraceae bacterium]
MHVDAGFSALSDPQVAACARTSAPDISILLEHLAHLHPKAIDSSLERMDRLLADLGRPSSPTARTPVRGEARARDVVLILLRCGRWRAGG